MIKKYRSHIIILALTIIGCDSNHADMVIHNGTIYTMDDYNPIVENVVVKDGKIIHVGSTNNYKKFVGPNTEVLDLNNSTMVPGLIEGHGHFMGLGYAKMRLDLSQVKNYDELVDIVEDAVKKHPQESGSLEEAGTKVNGQQRQIFLSKDFKLMIN